MRYYTGIFFKGEITDTRNMDESQRRYIEWKKPGLKEYVLCMKSQNRQNKSMVVTCGERGIINWEWAQGTFLGDRNVLYLDLSGAHIAVYMCQISLTYTL